MSLLDKLRDRARTKAETARRQRATLETRLAAFVTAEATGATIDEAEAVKVLDALGISAEAFEALAVQERERREAARELADLPAARERLHALQVERAEHNRHIEETRAANAAESFRLDTELGSARAEVKRLDAIEATLAPINQHRHAARSLDSLRTHLAAAEKTLAEWQASMDRLKADRHAAHGVALWRHDEGIRAAQAAVEKARQDLGTAEGEALRLGNEIEHARERIASMAQT